MKREKCLNRLRRTFRKQRISLEARADERYWVSNGVWLANVRRGELHHLLPVLPVNALEHIGSMQPGDAVAYSEEGGQMDFGGMFPALELALGFADKVLDTVLVADFGDTRARLLVVDFTGGLGGELCERRLVQVDPDLFEVLRDLVEPDEVVGRDEGSLVAFKRDGEVEAALAPVGGGEIELRDACAKVMAARWNPAVPHG